MPLAGCSWDSIPRLDILTSSTFSIFDAVSLATLAGISGWLLLFAVTYYQARHSSQ